MSEYNVALLDTFFGRIRLGRVHGAANAAATAVTAAKAQVQDAQNQYAGGSTLDSSTYNRVSGTNPVGGQAAPTQQRIPALPTTIKQP